MPSSVLAATATGHEEQRPRAAASLIDTSGARTARTVGRRATQLRRELGDGRLPNNIASGSASRSRARSRRARRMAESESPPASKKLVVDADRPAVERLRERARASVASSGVTRRHDPGSSRAGAAAEGAPIELAARRQRQAVDDDDARREHVRRAAEPRVGANGLRRTSPSSPRHDVGDEALVARARPRRSRPRRETPAHCRSTARPRPARRESADLDLIVEAAQELEPTVGAAAHEIAGAIEPLAGANGLATKRSRVAASSSR